METARKPTDTVRSGALRIALLARPLKGRFRRISPLGAGVDDLLNLPPQPTFTIAEPNPRVGGRADTRSILQANRLSAHDCRARSNSVPDTGPSKFLRCQLNAPRPRFRTGCLQAVTSPDGTLSPPGIATPRLSGS